jgi:hypothetical protein
MKNEFTTPKGETFSLTEGELSIISCLKKLNKLWKNHGDRLVLFCGSCSTNVRMIDQYGSAWADDEIACFPDIIGDGGDGGDLSKNMDRMR